MGKGMMNNTSVSIVFAMFVLIVSALLICHIVFTLWNKRYLLRELREQHNPLIHSLPMSLGMISTMTICSMMGSLMMDKLSFAYIFGLIIGLFVSLLLSFPLNDIALVDGMIAGAMGGLMGVMLGVMVPLIGLYTLTTFLMMLFVFSWVVMYRRIHKIELVMEVTQKHHHQLNEAAPLKKARQSEL